MQQQAVLALVVLALGPGIARATPHAACVLEGRQAHLKVTVSPAGVPPFEVEVAASPARVIPGTGALARAIVASPLRFEGGVRADQVAAYARRPFAAAGGILQVAGGVPLDRPRQLAGALQVDLERHGIAGVRLGCDAVTLDAPLAVGKVHVEAPADSRRLEPSRDRLRLWALPERQGPSLEVRGPRLFAGSKVQGDWVHLHWWPEDDQEIALRGWVHRSDIRAPRPEGYYGRGAGGLTGRRQEAAVNRYQGPGKVRAGTPLHAEPGRGRWATLVVDRELTVAGRAFDEWLEVVEVPGLTMPVSHVRRAAVEAPLKEAKYLADLRTLIIQAQAPGEPVRAAATLGDGRLLEIGDDPDGRVSDRTHLFDPFTGLRTEGPRLPRPLADAGAVRLADGRILIAGGVDAAGRPWRGTAVLDREGRSWVEGPPLRSARRAPQLLMMEHDRVLLGGGLDGAGQRLTGLELLDLTGGGWKEASLTRVQKAILAKAPTKLERWARLAPRAEPGLAQKLARWREKLHRSPSSPEACGWQAEAVLAMSKRDPRRRRELLAEIGRLAAMAGPEDCRRIRSEVLREVYSGWRDWRSPEGLTYGLMLIDERLRDLGQPQDVDATEDRYALSFYRAELLFLTAERVTAVPRLRALWRRAAGAYEAVIRLDRGPGAKYLREAAFAQLIAWKNWAGISDGGPVGGGLRTDLAPRPISARGEKMLAAFDVYRRFVPDASKEMRAKVLYNRARIFYEHNDFATAALYFQDLLTEHPRDTLAKFSGSLLLDCLDRLGRHGERTDWVQRLRALGIADD